MSTISERRQGSLMAQGLCLEDLTSFCQLVTREAEQLGLEVHYFSFSPKG